MTTELRKIRVLSVFGSSVMTNRGTPIRVRNLLSRLSKDDDFILYTHTADDVVSFRTNHSRFLGSFLKDLKYILKLIADKNIDVVVGHTITTYKLLTCVKFFTKAKVVLEMHGFIEEETRKKEALLEIKYNLSKFVFSVFYRMVDLITTCSLSAAEKIKPYNKNTIAIYGGVDTDLFRPIQNPPHQKMIIGYAGNTRTWQGLDFLIDVFVSKKLALQDFELKLLLSEPFTLQNGTIGVTQISAVPSEEVPNILAQCDMLVIPREQNEINRLSFPSKLMEYLAMGIPVVASKTSDMHKIITHGTDGLLYEPGDKKALALCFLELRDSTLRTKLGANARSLVENQYTWDKQAAVFIASIKSIIPK